MKFEMEFPQEIEQQLAKLANFDKVAPQMLQAAGPFAVAAIRNRLRPHNRTMHLMDSVTAGKVKKRRTGGHSLTINFKGYDKSRKPTPGYPSGVPNAVKAAGLEYGNAHEPARPFMRAAANDCAGETAAEMQRVLKAEAGI